MELPWVDQTDVLARIGREPALTLQLAQADAGERRAALEGFIRQRFAEHYQARVRHFMPCLLGLHDQNGEVQGAVGLRSAQRRPLFLERYLDEPIERAVSQRCGLEVTRTEIVEVGNLAAFGNASARLLIVALTDLLVAQGFRWVVFTGTPALLNSFQRLALEPLALAPADPARMGEELADWGSYYASRPQLMAGEILPGHQRLLQLGIYARLGYQPLFDASEVPHAACS
ncbi:thermostable hemolysin [Pseudomonas songnenensis]|uniref:Thermostable hemolysin n=1 Tax=Pseudomonas songnenensis TaxID=1176259 RepID=A0A482UBB2_9PSED|nr:thermostable hemolysin [Pseudomonas songnenensis]RYJ62387.1 thermostable hemolysin [Pseudomonas songnenensis]